MKLWQKKDRLDKSMEAYTVGDDYILDQELVPFDCQASKAHAQMLKKIGVLSAEELSVLEKGLEKILSLHEKGEFQILQSDEDCHTAIENYLVENCGECGKKIHTARSRNDQVLTAYRLYQKNCLVQISEQIVSVIDALRNLGKTDCPMPGYTHMQPAMPTTLNEWCRSFISAMEDNRKLSSSLTEIIDQSPLGSAAGYGVPVLDIKREQTASSLGFSRVQESPIYAQHSRGKFDGLMLSLLSTIMLDFNKIASDLILYNTREFGLVKLPGEFCTGSSIMPQKKNPDILELMRGKYHQVIGHEMAVKGISSNLISGYNRDMQLTKGHLMQSMQIVFDTLVIAPVLIGGIEFDSTRAKELMGEELYATERAYKLVQKGYTFRDAYREVGKKYS